MPEDVLPPPSKLFSSQTNALPPPSALFDGDKLKQPLEEKDAFTSFQEGQEKDAKLNQIIESVPDMDDGRKQSLKDLVKSGTIKGQQITDAILTYQGKHHKQAMDGSIKYYTDEKGIPHPLANNERPPKEYQINSIWGEQSDAEDDSPLTTLGKNIGNILPSIAENAIDLVHMPYGAITGEEADWYKSLKNSANYLKAKTSSASQAPVINTEGIDEFTDIFEGDRWNFTADNVAGTVGQIMKSVGEFAVGGGFVSKAVGATSKLGKGASLFTASYATQLGETIDRAKEAGLTTEDAYRVGSAINVPIAMVDLALGVEGRLFKDELAKTGRKELVDNLVSGFVKDSEGKITKEGLDELFKSTLIANTALVKNWGKQTMGDIVGEGSQEAIQAFVQNAGEQLYDKMSDEEKAKFGTDAFSPKAFADYLQNFVVGALGGAPTMLAYNKIKKITKDNEQSKTAFGLVQQKDGESQEDLMTRINSYKGNILNEVEQGKITKEQADNAIFRIDSYRNYNEKVQGLNIDETEKRQLFDLSFKKEELVGELVGEMKGKSLDDMNPIDQAKYKTKEKIAQDMQKQINEIVMKAQLKEETTVADKTIEDAAKKENPPKKEGEKKIKLNPIAQALSNKYKDDKKEKSVKEYPKHELSYGETSTDVFNALHPREIHRVLSEHLQKQPNQSMSGTVLKIPYDRGKNNIFTVEMDEAKQIQFASSRIRKDEWKNSHLVNVRDETVMKKDGEYMVLDRDKLADKPVAIKVYTVENDGRKKNAIKIYNPQNGKFIAWAKETMGGVNDFTHKEINGKGGLIDIERKVEDIIPPSQEEGGETVVPKKPVPTQPKGTGNVQVPTKDEFVAQNIEALKTSEDDSFDQELEDNGTYKSILEQQYNKVYGKKVTPESVKNKIANYNNLGKREKKDEFGRQLLNKIQEDASSIGYQIGQLNKGKITLLNEKGTKVYNEPKVRTKEAIRSEKDRKVYEKKALNADPVNVAHMVAMDIANGVKFNQDEFLQIMGENYKKDNMPFGLFVKKGGVSFEFYKQRMAEMQGIETPEMGDEQSIAEQAAYEVSQYSNSTFRADAKEHAIEAYERFQNGGMTNKQVEDMAENLKLSEPQTEPIIEVVNNTNEEETDESNTELKTAKNDTEEINAASKIVGNYFGQEKGTNNPFDDSFSEEESTEQKDIIKRDDLKEDPFQKPKNIENEAESIISGEAVFKRLSPTEELGRIKGGRRNVEASLILNGVQKASGTLKERVGKLSEVKSNEESALEKYAKEKGIWHPDTTKEFGEPHANGFEQDVYLEGNNVVKINNGLANENWMELLDRVSIHNSLFPDTAYTVEGFGKNENGDFIVILKQPLIKGVPAKFSEVKSELQKRGYEILNEADNVADIVFRNKQNGTIISDVHGENVIKGKNGNLYFIDPLVNADTLGAGYGGNRKLGNGEIVNKEKEREVKKIVDTLRKVLSKDIIIIYDSKLKGAGKWNPKTKTITINPKLAGKDTPIHEVGHILIDAMGGTGNRVINKAIEQLKGTPLWKETEGRYPLSENYTIDDLGMEVLAEAIGREGKDIFETEAEKSTFRTYLDYIFNWLKRNLGLEKNIAKNLAKQVISGINIKPTEVGGKESFQNEKKTQIEELQFDLEAIEEQLDIEEDEDNITELERVRDVILEQIETLESGVESYKERENIINGLDIDKATLPELINAFVALEQQAIALTEETGEKHYTDKQKLNDLKDKIGEILNNTQLDKLEKKWGKEITKMANKRDLNWLEGWTKAMGHISQEFPAIQGLYNQYNQINLDKEKETYSRKNELDKKAKAVIKEVNKKLGVKDWALGFITSNSAKYFNYLENNGKYLTLAEAKAKGLSKAQIEYLEAVRELVKEKNKLAGKETDDLEVIKIDKGFKEAYKDDGFMAAMSLYMGGGSNIDTPVTYTLDGKTKTVPYKDAQKAILDYSKGGLKEKAIALGKLLSISHKAKKGAYRSDKNINYSGILTSKFGRPYDKVVGYSKDYHAATMQLIDDVAHVKHYGKLVPLANSVEFFYTKLGIPKTEDEQGMQYGETLDFIRHWKNEQIYQKMVQTTPTIDAVAKFLRHMTSLTVMSFAVPANIMNLAIGTYNSIRKEGWTTWVKGQKELFFGDKERAGFGFVGKKANDINNKYQIVKSDLDSNPKNHIGKWFDQLAFAGTRFGEYQIQLSLALGLMKDAKMLDSFTYKDGDLVLKNGINEKEFEEKINEIKDKISNIHGKYDPKDRRKMARYELGKAALQFKNWIPDWTKERFGAEYIDSKGTLYRGSVRMLSSTAIKEMKADMATHGKWLGLFKGDSVASKNFRSNLNGLLFLTTLYVLTHSDDDDEKKKRETLSLDNAMEQVLFVYDPSQAKYLLDSPIASWGIIKKFLTIIEDIIDGKTEKAGKTAKKLIPHNKAYDSVNYLLGNDKK